MQKILKYSVEHILNMLQKYLKYSAEKNTVNIAQKNTNNSDMTITSK